MRKPSDVRRRAMAIVRDIGCEVVDHVEPESAGGVVVRPNRAAFVAWMMRGNRLEDWSGANSVHFEPDPAA